jgi:hypothetical protein
MVLSKRKYIKQGKGYYLNSLEMYHTYKTMNQFTDE